MSLADFNATLQAQVFDAVYQSTASYVVPPLLLESFTMGVLCACVPIGTYMLWIKPSHIPRATSITTLWVVLAMSVLHWALSMRQLELTLSGRSLGLTLGVFVMSDAIAAQIKQQGIPSPQYAAKLALIEAAYTIYSSTWPYLFPLIAETVLLGFASFLFAVVARNSISAFCHLRFTGRSCFPLMIPIMAFIMYTFSLAHWAVSLYVFVWPIIPAHIAQTANDSIIVSLVPINIVGTTIASLSFNVIISDAIVLWRMCIVWNKARSILAFAAVLVLTTLSLNIANIIVRTTTNSLVQIVDTEILPIYGSTPLGLATTFVSLASNFSATALVALKAWLHWRQTKDFHVGRTMAQRFMMLLVDSGVVYTAIWLLYCISFFRPITTQPISGTTWGGDLIVVRAASYLDAAMAQITTIYPLAVFILVALDKTHHSRRPHALRHGERPLNEMAPASSAPEMVTVTFEVEVERSRLSSADSVRQEADEVVNKEAITVGEA